MDGFEWAGLGGEVRGGVYEVMWPEGTGLGSQVLDSGSFPKLQQLLAPGQTPNHCPLPLPDPGHPMDSSSPLKTARLPPLGSLPQPHPSVPEKEPFFL